MAGLVADLGQRELRVRAPQIALLVIGVIVMLVVLIRLRKAFRARSGGVGFRV